MNKVLIFGVFMLCFLGGNAQSVSGNLDVRLSDIYSPEQLSGMAINQPQTLAYLNFYVQNAYEIVHNVPAYKLVAFEDISTLTNGITGLPVTEQDLQNLNVLKLSITREKTQYLTFKVGETGKVVVFLSPERIMQDFLNTQNQ